MNPRVLVMEPDPDVKRLVEEVLVAYGYQTVTAACHWGPDVIVSAEPLFVDLGVPVVRFSKPFIISVLVADVRRATQGVRGLNGAAGPGRRRENSAAEW